MNKQSKIPVSSPVRIDAYHVISCAVEKGVLCGWNLSRKYTDQPDECLLCEQMSEQVMLALCEVLKFEEVEEG